MKPTSDAIAVSILAVFLLFVAVNLQAGWVFGVDALLFGLIAVGWLSARNSVSGLTITRQLAPEAVEGEALAVTLTVTVRRGRHYFLELYDAVPGLAAAVSIIPACDARQPATVTYQTVARQRGVHEVETLEVRSGGLTGLFTVRRRLPAPGALTIFPRYWPLRGFPLSGSTGAEAASATVPTREGVDVAGVREFRDGDSLRHVHWRSTARRGALVVREFERTVHQPVVVLLDTNAAAYGSARGNEAFEDLVRAAASITFAVTQAGQAAQLVAGSRETPLAAVMGWTQALHWLARVQPDGRVSLPDLYAATMPAGAAVVACSPDADAVAILAQRGIPLAAVLVDVASYAASSPSSSAGNSSGRTVDRVPVAGNQPRAATTGETLLEALGVPAVTLRSGEEVGACLRAFSR